MARRWLILILASVMVAGCGSVGIEAYRGTTPQLVLEDYMNGPLRAWGVFRGRNGQVQRQFVVDLNGTWDPATQTLVLDEDFTYADGQTEQRQWTLRKTGPDTWEGSSPDAIGIAIGRTAGNAFNFVYDYNVRREDGSTIRLHFDDWMFLQPDGVLINQAEVSKYGFTVGEVLISFQKGAQGGGTAATAPASVPVEAAE